MWTKANFGMKELILTHDGKNDPWNLDCCALLVPFSQISNLMQRRSESNVLAMGLRLLAQSHKDGLPLRIDNLILPQDTRIRASVHRFQLTCVIYNFVIW